MTDDIVELLRAQAPGNRLMADAADEIERLLREVEVQSYWGLRWEKTNAELVAAQAREAKLRRWIATSPVVIARDDEIAMAKERKREILAMSTDDTTLNERLAQERERCAKACNPSQYPNEADRNIAHKCAAAICNLGDEQ